MQTPRTAPDARAQWATAALAAAGLLLLAFVALPLLRALWLSLHDYDLAGPGSSRWDLGGNYSQALKADGYQKALAVTVAFAAGSVVLSTAGGALVAAALGAARSWSWRVALLPFAVAPVVSAVVWRALFDLRDGLVPGHGLDRAWLAGEPDALAVMILADAWRATPLMAVALVLARRAGAPRARSLLLAAVAWRALDALRAFGLPFALAGGANATGTVQLEAWQTFVQDGIVGYGAAQAVIALALVIPPAAVFALALARAAATAPAPSGPAPAAPARGPLAIAAAALLALPLAWLLIASLRHGGLGNYGDALTGDFARSLATGLGLALAAAAIAGGLAAAAGAAARPLPVAPLAALVALPALIVALPLSELGLDGRAGLVLAEAALALPLALLLIGRTGVPATAAAVFLVVWNESAAALTLGPDSPTATAALATLPAAPLGVLAAAAVLTALVPAALTLLPVRAHGEPPGTQGR